LDISTHPLVQGHGVRRGHDRSRRQHTLAAAWRSISLSLRTRPHCHPPEGASKPASAVRRSGAPASISGLAVARTHPGHHRDSRPTEQARSRLFKARPFI